MVAQSVVYTVEQVAQMLGVSRASAYEAVRRGDLPRIRLGRRWLIPQAAFLAWLEKAGQTPKDEEGRL